MKLGRGGGRRSVQTPNTSGLARRVENRLAAVADSYVAKTETSLAVDGVPLFIWNKREGRYKCACQFEGGALGAFNATTSQDASGKPIAVYQKTGRKVKNKFMPLSETVHDLNTDSSVTDTFESTTRSKILDKDTDKVNEKMFDYASRLINKGIKGNPNDLTNVLDAFDEADELLSDKIITCPICHGSGKVDSWAPANGNRLLFDLSSRFEVDLFDVDMVNSQVPTFIIKPNGYVEWSFDLPVTWLTLERASLFMGDKLIPRSDYRATLTLPDDTEYTLSKEVLRNLKGASVITEGKCRLKIQPMEGNELTVTHFDLIYMNARPFKAQLPEIEIPYEDEYADWNLNINIELTAKATIKEGSYICDAKYKRVWKVDSFSPKRLANSQILGYTAQCRALQSFEKLFVLFNMFAR